jgi:hypothetical protein
VASRWPHDGAMAAPSSNFTVVEVHSVRRGGSRTFNIEA